MGYSINGTIHTKCNASAKRIGGDEDGYWICSKCNVGFCIEARNGHDFENIECYDCGSMARYCGGSYCTLDCIPTFKCVKCGRMWEARDKNIIREARWMKGILEVRNLDSLEWKYF